MAVLTGDEIQKTYAEALKLHNAGNLNAAIAIYGRIIDANPKIAEAHFQVGRIFTSADNFDRAFTHLKAAAELRPKEGAIWFAWAEAVALGGNSAAEAEFLHMLKAAPTDITVKLTLQDRFGARRNSTRPATGGAAPGDIRRIVGLMESGRPADAEKLAARLLSLHPGAAVIMNVLATAQAIQGKEAQAEQSFQKAIKLDPKYAEAYDNFGRFLVERDRIDEATKYFRRALTLAPGLPSALVNLSTSFLAANKPKAALTLIERADSAGTTAIAFLIAKGNVLMRLRNYERAEEAFRKAVEVTNGTHHESIALLGQAQSRMGGKDAEAMENYERALAIEPNSRVAVGGKATLLQLLGRFDEAETYFRKGFEIDPMNGENYRAFITSHKTQPGDPVLAQMLGRFDDPRLAENEKMNLGFAIAKALEDVKDYAKVFKYLNEANALMQKAYPYDIAQRLLSIELTKAAFDGFDWKGAHVEGTSSFAPIFVTGMPRSGTTLIEQIISSHSKVTGAGEVGYGTRSAQLLMADGKTARPIASIAEDEIARLGINFEQYIRARFPEVEQVTDKSIQTYQYLGLIKLALPNARFVVVRRDPRDNLLSMYKNKFPDDTHLYAYDQTDLAKFYGTFVDMIDFWRERVPEWFYEVQYEELVANPEEETRKLIAACGLGWEDACLSFHENKRKVETLSVYQVRQPISKASVALWQRYEKDLKPMLDALKEGGHVPG